MKDEYLRRLEELLTTNNIENKEEVLSKYKKRYEFGLESEMTETEIEEMLGSPEDIVSKLKRNEVVGSIISIKTVSDDVTFVPSKDDKTHIQLYGVDQDAYNISVTPKEIIVEYKSNKYLGLNRRKSGNINILIPEERTFKKIYLETTSGDIESKIDLISERVEINTVSGDLEFNRFETNSTIINLVSGDLEIGELISNKIVINTVSGDIDCNLVKADKLTIDSVSGDVTIDNGTINSVVTNSISGDCIINGETQKNFKKIMKEQKK